MDTTTNSSIVASPNKLLPRNKGVPTDHDKAQEKSLVETSHLDFTDEVDGIRGKANFNWLDMFCILVSICSYVADLITDGFMAAAYYRYSHYWYFGFTLAFVAIPAFTMSGLSAKWYYKDQNNQHFPPVSKCTWVFRIFCLVFFLSPVARYVDTLRYGLQSRRAKKKRDFSKMGQCYARMAYEDADATFLRLFECFMESAPQLVLQLYIMAKEDPFHFRVDPIVVTFQAASVVTSVISLAWALTTYNRSLRFAQVDKENIHLLGTSVLFLAHLFGIVARVIALSVFASKYNWFIWVVCLGHWILMAIWLWLQKTAACSTRTEEFFFCLILAIIHVFTFFNVKPDRTRFRYAFYYTVCFLENTTLMVLWWLKVSDEDPRPWFHYPALIGQVASFALSIALLGFYYSRLHPNLLLPNVGICTKNGPICLSDTQPPPIVNGVPSPRTSPARLGRLDIQQEALPEM